MIPPNSGAAGGNRSEHDDVPFSFDVQLFKRPTPASAKAQTSCAKLTRLKKQQTKLFSLSASAISSGGAAMIWKWLSFQHAPAILGSCITAAALMAASYFFVFARGPEQAAVATSKKTDFLTSMEQSAGAVKGSPTAVRQTTTSGRTYLPESQAGGKQDLNDTEHQTTIGQSDAQKWVVVTKKPEFQTYFLKEVKGKGSSDARVSMLTNFAATQLLPDGSASYSSLLYVISIDCRKSIGGPVEVFWNSGLFLSGEYLSNPMPPVKQKQFAGNDPMLLFACN